MPWSTPFDDPIALQGGGSLAAETGGGWLMFARIAMMRALDADGKED